MSDIPKAREELHSLLKQLEKGDLPKSYIIERLRHAILFMFKDKEPPIDLEGPVLKDHLGSVSKSTVLQVFNQLEQTNLNSRDHDFVRDVHEGFEEYGSVTSKQWQTLLKIKDRYENDLGVS